MRRLMDYYRMNKLAYPGVPPTDILQKARSDIRVEEAEARMRAMIDVKKRFEKIKNEFRAEFDELVGEEKKDWVIV